MESTSRRNTTKKRINMKMHKIIGTYYDVTVVAVLPEDPIEYPYCYCTAKDKAITNNIISFSRDAWKDEKVLEQCFIQAVGIGVSIYLDKFYKGQI